MIKMKIQLTALCASLFLMMACGPAENKDYWGDLGGTTPPKPEPKPEITEKPRFIWIDAAANFPDFANSKEAIARDLALAKDAGFTDIVVDVRPTTGDVLFKTDAVKQVSELFAWTSNGYEKIPRTATWDYLQAFIDEGKRLGLRVHAAINTFVGGHKDNGGTGILYRDASKKAWATQLNTSDGIKSIMDTDAGTKFLNPAHPDVQAFLCQLLKDLARYSLDGIFLDRGRYLNLQTDFSDVSRKQFEAYLGGIRLQNYPEDILPVGAKSLPSSQSAYLKRWLEYRAKTIYDFMQKARDAVKSVNSHIKFGVYVGGWYSTYYEVGVNWAASTYNTSARYNWATDKYKNFGYAALMDQMLIGAYASPLKVYGNTEWTMQGFCALAKDKIKGQCKMVAGGPDVGNWDYDDKATQEQENQAIVNSVKACMDACDGYFLFDMIHLKKASQWSYAKEGIAEALKH